MANPTRFCPESMSLLREQSDGNRIVYISEKTGSSYEIDANQTLLFSKESQETLSLSKYRNALNNSAQNPALTKQIKPCPTCKRQITTMNVLGDDKKVFYTCLCGVTFT